MQNNTIRDGGSIALYTAYTVDTVDMAYTVDTVDMAYTVDTVYIAEVVYNTFDMAYIVDTVSTVGTVDTLTLFIVFGGGAGWGSIFLSIKFPKL